MIKGMKALKKGQGNSKKAAATKTDEKTASRKVVSFKQVNVAIKDIDTASQKVLAEFESGREFTIKDLKSSIALLKDMGREAAAQYRNTLALVSVALKKGVKTAKVEEAVEDLSILRSRLAMLTVQAETSLMQVDQNAYVVADGEGVDAEADGEGVDAEADGEGVDAEAGEGEEDEGDELDDLELELEPEGEEDEGDMDSESAEGEEDEGDFDDLEGGDEGDFEDLEGDFEDLEGDIDPDLLDDEDELEPEPASAKQVKKSTTSKKRATASKKKQASGDDMLSAVVSDGLLADD